MQSRDYLTFIHFIVLPDSEIGNHLIFESMYKPNPPAFKKVHQRRCRHKVKNRRGEEGYHQCKHRPVVEIDGVRMCKLHARKLLETLAEYGIIEDRTANSL